MPWARGLPGCNAPHYNERRTTWPPPVGTSTQPRGLAGRCGVGVYARCDLVRPRPSAAPPPGGRPAGGRSPQVDDRADADAGGEVAEGLVDLVERAVRGHQRPEVELAAPPHGDHAGDVAQRVAAAEEATHELLLRDAEQHQRIQHQLLVDPRRAHEDGAVTGQGGLDT